MNSVQTCGAPYRADNDGWDGENDASHTPGERQDLSSAGGLRRQNSLEINLPRDASKHLGKK